MRYLLLLLMLMLGGCSAIGPLASSDGMKTTTEYDKSGRITKQVQESKPLLDSQTAYQKTVQVVSANHKDAIASVSTGLQKSMASIAKDNKISKDAKAIMLYRGFESFEALGKYANLDPATIAAIQRSMSGYEVIDSLGGKVISGSMWGYLGHAAASTLKSFGQEMGDKTNIAVEGDGNKIDLDKREINTNVHANTTGDNSPTTPNTNSTTGCETGNCGESSGEEAADGPGTSLATCSDVWVVANVPGCSSCGSFYAGRCSIKPGEYHE